jgi:hypothetical protein
VISPDICEVPVTWTACLGPSEGTAKGGWQDPPRKKERAVGRWRVDGGLRRFIVVAFPGSKHSAERVRQVSFVVLQSDAI